MKLGLLSDAHGNCLALDNCLKIIEKEKVDEIIFIGDSVGYLPFAEQVLQRLKGINATCISGNHEAMLLGKLPLDLKKDEVYGLKKTKEELSDYQINFLKDWPTRKDCFFNSRKILFVHGSPWEELTGYIYPDSDLSGFIKLGYDVVFMGHTHRPFVKKAGKTKVVNIGSCGQPRDYGSLASCAVYDTATDDIKIIRVPFDADSIIKTSSRPIHPLVISCFKRRESVEPFGSIRT